MVSVAFSSAFHDASGGCDSLNFHTFELALKDVDGDTSDATDPAEERAGLAEPSKLARRGSVFMVATPPATPETAADGLVGEQHIHHHHHQQQQQQQQAEPPAPAPASSSSAGKPAAAMYRQTSAHRLFRTAPPEPKRQQWKVCEETPLAGDDTAAASTAAASTAAAPMCGEDSRLRSSSWHASDSSRRSPPPPPGLEYGHSNNKNDRFFPKRIMGRDDREVLDGSDVLQQISNLTSTEPSNEREVFVGGLRESEDAVHITEEELATYFAKFGVIESVSINRDDRTQRGRGFAFVKFFQESAALNAVVADASTHVIRGTTVSVQWSRGAKDAGSGGDRPRRRNSGTSNSSSGNGSSPSNGSGRSCARLGMFPHKGGVGRTGGGAGGGGGGGACGVGCSNGFSPMRSRGVGHSMHGPSAGGGGVPYGFNGGRHGEHHNQPMVCVVVPAQRAAALGLAPHPPHGLHSTGKCTSRGTAPCDGHFSSLAQSSAASGGGGGHPGYASHTRSHSQPISHGGGNGGGGGYGHHGGSPHSKFDHHHSGAAVGTPHHLSVSPSHHVSPSSSHHFSPSSGHHISPSSGHHVSPSPGRSYGGPPAMHMPPMPRERQGRAEPRDYPAGASGSGGSSPSFGEYERSSQSESHLHSPYALPEWGYDDAGGSGAGRAVGGAMATAHGVVRSQSPPPMVRSRNGGGAPRPPSASPRAYDGHYSSTRYNGRGGFDGFSVAGIGGASGGVATRRRSESSAMVGRSSIQQDALAAAASYYYAVDDMGKDDVAYSHDRRGGGSRGPASRLP